MNKNKYGQFMNKTRHVISLNTRYIYIPDPSGVIRMSNLVNQDINLPLKSLSKCHMQQCYFEIINSVKLPVTVFIYCMAGRSRRNSFILKKNALFYQNLHIYHSLLNRRYIFILNNLCLHVHLT